MQRGIEALVGDHLVAVAVVLVLEERRVVLLVLLDQDVVLDQRLVVEVVLVDHRRLVGHGRDRRPRLAPGGPERLVLQARHLAGVGAVAALELEVIFDGVVEQSHGCTNPSDGARFLQLGRRLRPHRAVLARPLGAIEGLVGGRDEPAHVVR